MATPDPSARKKKIVVLISGSGTNLAALITACADSTIPNAQITRVISDRSAAYGLVRAQNAGIPTTHHGILGYKKRFPDTSASPEFKEAREAYDADLAQLVLEEEPDIVVCAGFMRILTPALLTPLQTSNTPIINLHPSLHGDLVGANCIERAWEKFSEGRRVKTGVMVHFVIGEVDKGGLVCEREVGIEGCKTLGELEERIHGVEHGLIVEGTRMVLAGG